ncbi:MAG: hypothetical protein EB117_09190 [Betaproteobacteria bacterium]|nr:hypothetical protein [Betaproteobacteria bacterium]
MEWRNEAALANQKEQLNAQCEAAAKTLREANDELQRGQTDIASRLAKYKRLHPSTCVIVSESADTTSGWRGYARADELLDFAAECEGYRQQRIALERLLK